jgi:hypothetical protein
VSHSIRAAQQLGSQALFEAAARVTRHHAVKLDSRIRRMQAAHEQGQQSSSESLGANVARA